MPTYNFWCPCGVNYPNYIKRMNDPNPQCPLCNSEMKQKFYPSHISDIPVGTIDRNIIRGGKPVEIRSKTHLREVAAKHNVRIE